MNGKIAYLTIDDAPSADFTQKVDYLLSKDIPAIFFCTGEALEKRPKPVIDAIHKGFLIGNHTYDHPHFSEIPLDACFEQIQRTDQIIDTIYSQAGEAVPAKYFRFPYGDKGALTRDDPFAPMPEVGQKRKIALQSELHRLGYSQPEFTDVTYSYYKAPNLLEDVDWYWTYDVHEWSIYFGEYSHGIHTLDDVFARMDEDFPEDGRGLNFPDSSEIILTHDHVETTPIFPKIIDRLLQKGLEFRLPS